MARSVTTFLEPPKLIWVVFLDQFRENLAGTPFELGGGTLWNNVFFDFH